MNLRTWLHNAVIDLRVTDILVAIFTVVLAIVAYLQYRELHSGGEDTKKLISHAQHSADAADRSTKAAETSALAASSFSKSAKAIVVGLNTATDKMQVAVKESVSWRRALEILSESPTISLELIAERG